MLLVKNATSGFIIIKARNCIRTRLRDSIRMRFDEPSQSLIPVVNEYDKINGTKTTHFVQLFLSDKLIILGPTAQPDAALEMVRIRKMTLIENMQKK